MPPSTPASSQPDIQSPALAASTEGTPAVSSAEKPASVLRSEATEGAPQHSEHPQPQALQPVQADPLLQAVQAAAVEAVLQQLVEAIDHDCAKSSEQQPMQSTAEPPQQAPAQPAERESHSDLHELPEALAWTHKRSAVRNIEQLLHPSPSSGPEQALIQAYSLPQSPIPPVVRDFNQSPWAPALDPQQAVEQALPTSFLLPTSVPTALSEAAVPKSHNLSTYLTPFPEQAPKQARAHTPPQSYASDAEADPVKPNNYDHGQANIEANETAGDGADDMGTCLSHTR